MKKHALVTIAATFLALPGMAAAQELEGVRDLVLAAGQILNLIIPIIITIALIVFFWGLVQYIYKSGEEDSREVAIRRMVGGVVAFFVIVSLWGLVYFLQQALNIRDINSMSIPTINRYVPY